MASCITCELIATRMCISTSCRVWRTSRKSAAVLGVPEEERVSEQMMNQIAAHVQRVLMHSQEL